MSEKIIKTVKLPSGSTAIAMETKTGVAIEIGAGTIFLNVKDIFDFVRLLKGVDQHFLKKCDDSEKLPGGFA